MQDELRQLLSLPVSQLRQRAAAAGATPREIDAAGDADCAREALVDLVVSFLKKSRPAAARHDSKPGGPRLLEFSKPGWPWLLEFPRLKWFMSTQLLGLATLVLSIYQLNTFTEIYTNMQDGALFSQMHDTYASVEMNDAFWLVEGFYDSHSRQHPVGWADPAGWINSAEPQTASEEPDHRSAEKRVIDAFVRLRGDHASSPPERFRQMDQARRIILHWYGKMINLYSAGLLRRSYLLLHPGALRAKHFLRVVVPLARGSCQLNGLEPTCRDSMFQQLREIMDLGDSNGTDECYVNPDNSACRSNRPLDDL